MPVNNGSIQKVTYFIGSRPIWKFIHPFIKRKLDKINKVQNEEDEPVRKRRQELIRSGYTFSSIPANYLNASSFEPKLICPKLQNKHIVKIEESTDSNLTQFSVEKRNFLYWTDKLGRWHFWSEVCPHEGASLSDSLTSPSTGKLRCPWHGLEFSPLILDNYNLTGYCTNVEIRKTSPTEITVSPRL